jgi:hypothetical protein
MSDLLLGLAHLIQHRYFQLSAVSGGAQQIPVGQQFETYCKDWLSLLPPGRLQNRSLNYSAAFCHEGSANNPPDAMYRGGNLGDAFEFKKFQRLPTAIPLNSSYPKDKLQINSPSITQTCITCEAWNTRTLYYVIGAIPPSSQRVKSLWVADGELLAASHTFYENLFNSIKQNLSTYATSIGALSTNSVELARLKNIDPLHYTTMRGRAMWELMSPNEAFKALHDVKEALTNSPISTVHALVTEDKWASYPITSQNALTALNGTPGFLLKHNIQLPNPNTPSSTIPTVLIRFEA